MDKSKNLTQIALIVGGEEKEWKELHALEKNIKDIAAKREDLENIQQEKESLNSHLDSLILNICLICFRNNMKR